MRSRKAPPIAWPRLLSDRRLGSAAPVVVDTSPGSGGVLAMVGSSVLAAVASATGVDAA
jgi:hypothetical protein